MDNLIIQKKALKFTIEVVAKDDEVDFNVTRYIDVEHNESMATNAKLAKSDALKVNGNFVNCNELMKKAIKGMETVMLPQAMNTKRNYKIRLKKSCSFGY